MMEVIFKGISSMNFSLGVKKYPPIPKAERNIEKIEIQGRDGFLTVDYGTHKGMSIPVEFNFVGVSTPENAILIKQWLDGYGDLIFSNEIDKKYKATVINSFDIESAIKNFGEFVVVFECQPHKYSIDNNLIALTTPGTIFNPTNATSKPVIKIYGTGSVDLTVNSNVIHLTNIADYVVIDSELMDCYKDTVLKNNDMNGDFPEFLPGDNYINWTGAVSKIEITPNWRWL